jgi:hypothetical protein
MQKLIAMLTVSVTVSWMTVGISDRIFYKKKPEMDPMMNAIAGRNRCEGRYAHQTSILMTSQIQHRLDGQDFDAIVV